MQWNEEAFILSARKFGENNLLVEVFAATRGLYSGMVRGGQSKKQIANWQPGNIIEATWRGRLEEQLGTFSGEVVNSVGAKAISEPLKLQAIISLTSLLRKTLPERNPYEELYQHHREFLHNLPIESNWLEQYVWMEIALLQYLGFGLDLSECAVTGRTDGLAYISPKTGRAVTEEGAEGYQDRLFKIPSFFSSYLQGAETSEIVQALEMTEYFIGKNLFAPHERKIPSERGRLVEMLQKHLQTRGKAGNLAQIA